MDGIAKYVVEVRFTPQGKILDRRGEIATSLKGELFEHWRILSNQVSFFSNKNKRVNAYFSYRNFAFISQSPNTQEFFIPEAQKFTKSAWDHMTTKHVTRIGLRALYFCKLDQDFKKILKDVHAMFLKPTSEELKGFGELVDVGFFLNFKEGDGNINLNFGPMEKDQAMDFFQGESSEFPENGVFVDIDYFQNINVMETKQAEVIKFIEKGVEKIEQKKKLILDSVV